MKLLSLQCQTNMILPNTHTNVVLRNNAVDSQYGNTVYIQHNDKKSQIHAQHTIVYCFTLKGTKTAIMMLAGTSAISAIALLYMMYKAANYTKDSLSTLVYEIKDDKVTIVARPNNKNKMDYFTHDVNGINGLNTLKANTEYLVVSGDNLVVMTAKADTTTDANKVKLDTSAPVQLITLKLDKIQNAFDNTLNAIKQASKAALDDLISKNDKKTNDDKIGKLKEKLADIDLIAFKQVGSSVSDSISNNIVPILMTIAIVALNAYIAYLASRLDQSETAVEIILNKSMLTSVVTAMTIATVLLVIAVIVKCFVTNSWTEPKSPLSNMSTIDMYTLIAVIVFLVAVVITMHALKEDPTLGEAVDEFVEQVHNVEDQQLKLAEAVREKNKVANVVNNAVIA